MRHARSDYDRIQDPTGLIPEDEPVFLIRAQDRAAPLSVRCWAMIAEEFGAAPELVQRALDWSDQMAAWQQKHGSKTPDIPADA